MRRLFFQNPRATAITAIMSGQTPESLIAQSRSAEFDGADAIAIDLCDLLPEFRNRESLERVINYNERRGLSRRKRVESGGRSRKLLYTYIPLSWCGGARS